MFTGLCYYLCVSSVCHQMINFLETATYLCDFKSQNFHVTFDLKYLVTKSAQNNIQTMYPNIYLEAFCHLYVNVCNG